MLGFFSSDPNQLRLSEYKLLAYCVLRSTQPPNLSSMENE